MYNVQQYIILDFFFKCRSNLMLIPLKCILFDIVLFKEFYTNTAIILFIH